MSMRRTHPHRTLRLIRGDLIGRRRSAEHGPSQRRKSAVNRSQTWFHRRGEKNGPIFATEVINEIRRPTRRHGRFQKEDQILRFKASDPVTTMALAAMSPLHLPTRCHRRGQKHDAKSAAHIIIAFGRSCVVHGSFQPESYILGHHSGGDVRCI